MDKILMSTERPRHFAHLLQLSKKYLLILYIFLHVLYMYIAPGQGQTTPCDQIFYFNINRLSIWSFAVSFVH